MSNLFQIAPTYAALNGHDAAAFIVSNNLARRNLTKGQQAMGMAFLYPEPEKGGRGHTKERAPETATLFSATRLKQARSILRHSRPLAEEVFAGRKPLDTALAEVKEWQVKSQSTEPQMNALRESAPDIADLVVEERITLAAAMAEVREREAIAEHVGLTQQRVGAILKEYKEPPVAETCIDTEPEQQEPEPAPPTKPNRAAEDRRREIDQARDVVKTAQSS